MGDIRTSGLGGIPFGGDSLRPSNPLLGQPYFNGESQRLELYTLGGWNNILQEVPGVSGIQGNYLQSSDSGTITVVGTNFASGAIVSAIGTNGVEVVASSTTFISLVQLTAVFTGLSGQYEPYNIKVMNPSNLFGLLPNALYVNATPVWQTAGGSLGTFDQRVSVSISAVAADSDSTITYTLASGSILPSGVTLNSSTGLISGTLPTITTDTTYSFTINASDGVNPAVPRTFSISSLRTLTLEYLILGGGGAGGDYFSGDGYNAAGGGGGAGGYIYSSPTTLRASSFSFPITVGAAGVSTATSNSSGGFASNGGNSSFNNIVAYGGGRGGAGNSSIINTYVAGSGGSGGGGVRPDGGPSFANAGAGTSGQGNAGGAYSSGDGDGGGGGGAATSGTVGGSGSQGGSGYASSITGSSVFYAAGGGGGKGLSGGWVSDNGGSGVGGDGGAKAAGAVGGNASTYGSGGGGAGSGANASSPFAKGGNGGSGAVIIAYPDTEPTATIPGTLTYNTPSRAGYRVYVFTAGTGTITI